MAVPLFTIGVNVLQFILSSSHSSMEISLFSSPFPGRLRLGGVKSSVPGIQLVHYESKALQAQSPSS